MEMTEPNELTSAAGLFWRRTLNVTDKHGNQTQITFFADSKESLEIKETTS
jgi:uncharacterized lipoprotein NlpE involved in copper resistance